MDVADRVLRNEVFDVPADVLDVMGPPLPAHVKANGAENAIEGAPPARNDRNGPLRVFPGSDRAVIESMPGEMEIRLHVHEVVRGKRQLVQFADEFSRRGPSDPASRSPRPSRG